MLQNNKFCLLILLSFFSFNVYSQRILKQFVNIKKNEYKVIEILSQIEQQTGARFSYNSESVNSEKVITFFAENVTVENCLNDIFNNEFKYKESGKYIVLISNTSNKNKETVKQKITIQGKITNSDNSPISNVSIYSVENQTSTISNEEGEFSFTFNSENDFNALSVGKIGFSDTLIVVNPKVSDKIDITLVSKENILKDLKNKNTLEDNNYFIDLLIPKLTLLNSDNLNYIKDTKAFQISILPGISSNLSQFGVLKNRISFNVLIGYSKGVDGFEVAGLMNFDKEDVNGFQIAGLSNFVGGDVNGIQVAGISNLVLSDIKATQFSGIANIVRGDVIGIQSAGIFNSNFNNTKGIQIGGVSNLNTGTFEGIQVAGTSNFVFDDFKGIQTAGILNFNLGKIDGVQISGMINTATDTVNGAQIAGTCNIAHTSNFQVSGLINATLNNKGIQIAPFNICDTSSGVSIGFLSIVRKGYNRLLFSSDEIFYTNLSLHLGTTKLYNVFNIAYQPIENLWGFSYGFGHKVNINKKIKLNFEIVTKTITSQKMNFDYLFNFYKFSTIFQFVIYKKVSIFAGPTLNYYIGLKDENLEVIDFISTTYNIPLIEKTNKFLLYKSWLGFQIGFTII